MLHRFFPKLLLLLFLFGTPGCGKTPVIPVLEKTDVIEQPTQPVPITRTPAVEPSQTRPVETRQAEEAVEEPSPEPQLFSSGWTTYSNPDFVRGVAVHNNQLWAATLGGIVAWDLDKKTSQLYTTWDGLAELQGNDVVYCSTPEERIWVAHEENVLSVYDLSLGKWSRIPITFEDGSTMYGVRTLFCDPQTKRLLIGSSTEIGILDLTNGRWERFGPKEGLQVENLRSIDVAGRAIWVAADKQGAFLIMGDSVFPFNQDSGFPSGPVNDLSAAVDASIWLGYPTGLIHYHDRKWNPYGAQSPKGIPFYSVDQVEVGPDKRVWIAGKNEGVCPFDTIKLACSTVYPGFQDKPITDLTVSADGIAFAATDGGGVYGLYPDGVQKFALEQAMLAGNDVRDIAEDQNGLLWVATDQGINLINLEKPLDPWQLLELRRDQPVLPRVNKLQPAENGMWLFYDQEALASFYDGKDWLDLDIQKGLSTPVQTSAVDWLGRVWLGTTNEILLWSDSLLRPYSPPDALGVNTFQAFHADGTGIWAGTDQGLLRYERYQWTEVLPQISVTAISEDPDGSLLLGTTTGLIRIKGPQSYIWIIKLEDEVLLDPYVTSIAWDHAGNLWVGTKDEGLLLFDGRKWERFDTSRGMPSNHIRKIYEDQFGTIWIAAVSGKGGGALVHFVP